MNGCFSDSLANECWWMSGQISVQKFEVGWSFCDDWSFAVVFAFPDSNQSFERCLLCWTLSLPVCCAHFVICRDAELLLHSQVRRCTCQPYWLVWKSRNYYCLGPVFWHCVTCIAGTILILLLTYILKLPMSYISVVSFTYILLFSLTCTLASLLIYIYDYTSWGSRRLDIQNKRCF